MRLETIGENYSQKWNDIISSAENGTLYHTWEWLKIVEKHTGTKLLPIVFYDADDDKPFGAIPLFYMKKFGLKMVFSPPPGSAITLGPVLVTKGYRQLKLELAYLDFQAHIDEFIKKLGAGYVHIVTSPGLLDIRPFSWAQYEVTPSYTYKINLCLGNDIIWRNISRTLRQDIKNTFAKGVHIVESGVDRIKDIDYIYDSLNKRYNEQHLNLRLQKSYIQNIVDDFEQSIWFLLAIQEGNTVGSTIFTTYKDTVTAWVGAVRFESNDLDVNGCIYQEAIARAIEHGYKWFEIMGANTRQLCAAKAKYCPTPDIYFVMKKTNMLGNLAETTYGLMKKRR